MASFEGKNGEQTPINENENKPSTPFKIPKKVILLLGGMILVAVTFIFIRSCNSCNDISIEVNNNIISDGDTLDFGKITFSVYEPCHKNIKWTIQLGTNQPIKGQGMQFTHSFTQVGDYKIIVEANNGKISKGVNVLVGSSEDYIYEVKSKFIVLINAIAKNYKEKEAKKLVTLFSENGNLISVRKYQQAANEVNCSGNISEYINRIKNTKVEIRIDGAELYRENFDNNGKIRTLELIENKKTLECNEDSSNNEEEIPMTLELQALIDIDYRTNPDAFDKLFRAIIDKKHNDILISRMITQVSEKMQSWNIQRDLTYKNGVKLNSKMSLQEFLKSLQGDRTNNISTIKIIKIQKGVKSSKEKETTNVIIIKKG